MNETLVTAAAAAVFAFGTAIFFALSSIERQVLSLAFTPARAQPAEGDVRFVHEALKRLTPRLPPANGLVILGGTALLVIQGVQAGWSAPTLAAPLIYWAVQAWIIVVQNIAADVRSVRATPSDGPLDQVSTNVRKLVRQHHTGLAVNLAVVVIQLWLLVP